MDQRLKGNFRTRSCHNLPHLRVSSNGTETVEGEAVCQAETLTPNASPLVRRSVVEGRRIVDIGFVIEQLEQGCLLCKGLLRLTITRGELRYGLASRSDIECEAAHCKAMNEVFTFRQHRGPATRGPKTFDVNTKLGFGKIIHAALLFFFSASDGYQSWQNFVCMRAYSSNRQCRS